MNCTKPWEDPLPAESAPAVLAPPPPSAPPGLPPGGPPGMPPGGPPPGMPPGGPPPGIPPPGGPAAAAALFASAFSSFLASSLPPQPHKPTDIKPRLKIQRYLGMERFLDESQEDRGTL